MDKDKKNKIDKTKENIGITKLNEESKKELFVKFVKAGGEVIDEKEKRSQLVIDRDKQKQYLKKIDGHKEILKKEESRKKQAVPSPTPSKRGELTAQGQSGIARAFTRFFIKLRLKFHGVAEFNGLYLKLKFLERFNNIYKPAMMELQMIHLDIFMKKPKTGNTIIEKLDAINPIHYELVMMVGDLYDKMLADQIVEHYVNFPSIPKKVFELKEPFLTIYKKLYVIRPHEDSIISSFERAIDLQQMIEKSKTSIFSSVKRKIKNDLYILFYKLFPRLHLLLCHYEGVNFPVNDSRIESILGIGKSDKPGNRMAFMKEAKEKSDEQVSEETAQEDTLQELPEYIKQGLQMIYSLNLKQMRKDFDKYGLFIKSVDNDKVLITYLIFNEFDSEYSFILTTNKLKFNVSFSRQGAVDYRNMLQGLYDEMRKCTEKFKNYSDILENFEKAKSEKPLNNAQYIEFSKRIELLQKNKNHLGKEALNTVNAFMDKVSDTLAELISDLDNDQSCIENPQDLIEFDTLIEGNKKLNGKKVYEAINIVYQFASALSYRLGPNGDLSGSIEMKEKEFKDSKIDQSKKTSETANTDQTEDKSLFEELDDML